MGEVSDAPQLALSRVVGRPLERVGGALEAAVGPQRDWVVESVDRANGVLVLVRHRVLGQSWAVTVRLDGAGGGRTRLDIDAGPDSAVVDELMGLLDAEIAGD